MKCTLDTIHELRSTFSSLKKKKDKNSFIFVQKPISNNQIIKIKFNGEGGGDNVQSQQTTNFSLDCAVHFNWKLFLLRYLFCKIHSK